MTQREAFTDCVVAEYKSMEKADLALEVLATDGFTADTVSRISFGQPSTQTSNAMGNECDRKPNSTQGLEGELPSVVKGNPDVQMADRAAGVGAIIGGAVSTPIALGSLIGPFFVVGPILGLGLGAAIGGLFGASERWGVRQDVASDYEKKVREGSVLVVVTDSSLRLHEAYKLLQTTGPFSIERFRVPDTPSTMA